MALHAAGIVLQHHTTADSEAAAVAAAAQNKTLENTTQFRLYSDFVRLLPVRQAMMSAAGVVCDAIPVCLRKTLTNGCLEIDVLSLGTSMCYY